MTLTAGPKRERSPPILGTLVRHALIGGLRVLGFYALFRHGLKVPLP